MTCRGCGSRASVSGRRAYYCDPDCVLKANSDQRGTCWIWTGYISKRNGEGFLTWEKTTMRLREFVGMIVGLEKNDTHVPDQNCGTPLCCNPLHSGMRQRRHALPRNKRKGNA